MFGPAASSLQYDAPQQLSEEHSMESSSASDTVNPSPWTLEGSEKALDLVFVRAKTPR